MRMKPLLLALGLALGLGPATLPLWQAGAQTETPPPAAPEQPTPAPADTTTAAPVEDAGFLERQIARLLGGKGRDVRVFGLRGVLSSQATIERIEVADADGVWLSVQDVALDWRRVALFRRRLEVNALTVGVVDLLRRPLPRPGEPPALAADAAATPFSLPELPVSVDVRDLSIGSLKLGQPVLGTAAALSVKGSAHLAGGAGDIKLSAVRIDGHDSQFTLDAGFDNATRQTRIDLALTEAEGGLVTRVTGIPGAPPLSLTIAGDAPLSDFTADIALATAGEDRLKGAVRIRDVPAGLLGGTEREITANLAGDVAELFLPDYQDFFGNSTALEFRALQGEDRGLDIEQLDLTTQGMRLSGTVSLNPAFLPEAVNLTATLGMQNGLPVVLPLSGPPVLVQNGTLAIRFDAAQGDDFTLDLVANGVQRADGILIDRLQLNAAGILDRASATQLAGVSADVTGGMQDFSSTNRALWQAVGDAATLKGRLDWRRGGALRLSGLDIAAGDLGLTGAAEVSGLDQGRAFLTTSLDARAADLARFSGVTGQTLAGSIDARVKASYDAVSGAFDLDLDGRTTDLSLGQADADGLLAGEVTLGLSAARTAQGITLDRLDLEGRRVDLTGTAAIAPDGFPRRFRLAGRVGEAEGAPVALPVPGARTTLQHATIDARYDAAEGEGFTLRLDGRDFAREGTIRIDRADVSADGTLARGPDGVMTGTTATVAATVAGAKAEDPALDAALAGGATFAGRVDWQAAADTISIRGLDFASGALSLRGLADIAGLRAGNPGVTAEGNLATGPLARFSALVGTPLTGELAAHVKTSYALATGFFDANLDGTATDVTIGGTGADALLAGPVALGLTARRDATGITIDRLSVDGTRVALDGRAKIGTDLWPLAVDLTGRLGNADGTSVLLPVPGQTLRLQAANIAASYDAALGDAFTLRLDATDFAQAGGVRIGTARVAADGTLVRRDGNLEGATAVLSAALAGATAADRGLAAALAPGANLTANLAWTAADQKLAVRDLRLASGELRLAADAVVTRPAAPGMAVSASFDAASGPLSRFSALAGRRLSGSATARGTASYASDTGFFDADVRFGGNGAGIGIAEVDQILRGASEIAFKGRRDANGLVLETARLDTAELDLTATGGVQGGVTRINVEGGLRDLGVFAPGFSGPLQIRAALTERNRTWSVDGNVNGPGGSQAHIRGDVLRPNGTVGFRADGSLPLGLANRFILPRTVEGTARFDLSMNGRPGLAALAGTVTVAGGRLADPVNHFTLERIGLTARLANSRATLDLAGDVGTGGRVSLTGPVGLTGGFPANLVATLTRVRLENPLLYEINLGGRIAVDGPLAGGARISGRIDIDRSEIRIPASLSSSGTLLDIRHVGEPQSSRITRERAGLLGSDGRQGAAAGGGPAYPLDLVISAPHQIFVRGRGLDVELGGRIEIAGTTARPIPSGGLDLIRGHLDLLARRLQFEEARIVLPGDLDPDIYMAATSQNAGIDARIVIQGPLSAPEMSFESNPELPQDEVLAQLFFGKPVQDLTPLEVAQLAAAIGTLTGQGGTGLFGRAREALGVDQLTLGTDEEGHTTVTAGRYLSERVYTDITVGEGGRSELQLNYEIFPGFSARGSFDSAGDTGLGIVFERDY